MTAHRIKDAFGVENGDILMSNVVRQLTPTIVSYNIERCANMEIVVTGMNYDHTL